MSGVDRSWLTVPRTITSVTKRCLTLYTTANGVHDSKVRRYAEDNRTEQNRIVRTGKYEAEVHVTNNVEKNCARGITARSAVFAVTQCLSVRPSVCLVRGSRQNE